MAGYPRYFYPRPPRGGRPEFPVRNANREIISIHALREEGDRAGLPESAGRKDFYPRPPRGGRREEELAAHHQKLFLSTPSARRATERLRVPRLSSPNFYPRPPRGGRLALARLFVHGMDFYPRPPRGGRQNSQSNNRCSTGFLSTPSARRATRWHKQTPDAPNDFYPRPPRGGRRGRMQRRVRRAGISIHALREEGDRGTGQLQANERGGFLSTPSARRATSGGADREIRHLISIHALREEGDWMAFPMV